MKNPTQTNAWQALEEHSRKFRAESFQLRSLIQAGRFQKFSASHEELLLDFSKHYLNAETLPLLTRLAEECGLADAIDSMFAGEKINSTEGRAVLHSALRKPESSRPDEVANALNKMSAFVSDIYNGRWLGATGKRIQHIVNIGIGGSDLGPALIVDALGNYRIEGIDTHFASNVDPTHLHSILQKVDPESTLFVVASKSFTTLETHQNANSAKQWLIGNGISESSLAAHFVAITSNLEAAENFGIARANLFPMWDWVGGRYSLWSAIGLPIALSIGMENFNALLAGAHSMDTHFQSANFDKNLPVISALLSVWYINFFESHSTAIVPYSQRLNLLPSFLQQLCMESLGKSSSIDGAPLNYRTGEVIWGTPGTNGQHSYFQLLHQGTEFIPVEFIAIINPETSEGTEQHNHLLANCFSQSKALMEGDDQENLHKYVRGNKPSSTLMISELSPANLGSLIAYFEHKVFVQSVIWNINAFDQWGVQLGKILSQTVYDVISGKFPGSSLDDSTANLIKRTQNTD